MKENRMKYISTLSYWLIAGFSVMSPLTSCGVEEFPAETESCDPEPMITCECLYYVGAFDGCDTDVIFACGGDAGCVGPIPPSCSYLDSQRYWCCDIGS